MSKEFVMGLRLNFTDNSFMRGIKSATAATTAFAKATGEAAAMKIGDNDFVGRIKSATAATKDLGKAAGATKAITAATDATKTFTAAVDDMGTAATWTRDSTGRLRDGMGRFVPVSEQVKAGMRGVSDNTVKASRSFTGMKGAMDSARTSADGLRTAVAAVITAGAIKGAWDWLVGANADMEQYQNTLTVVLGSQKKAVETLAWANKFAAKTPFEIPQVVEATTRMQAYGISAQKTLGIVGDMASVMGKDLMQAVEAVADAQTGELERLKEFGITKKMIQDQAKLLGSNPINNKGQITDTKAFNAALFSLMEKRFKGGMEMQSKSFKGMMSNVKDLMGTLGRQLGKPVFDEAKKGLQRLLDALNQLQASGAVDRFAKASARAFAAFSHGAGIAFRLVSAGFRTVWKVAEPIFQAIRKNWAKIEPYAQGVAIAIGAVASAMLAMRTATMLANVAMKLLNISMLTNPVGWLVLGLGLLVGWFIKLNGGIDGTKKTIEEFSSKAKAWWNSDGVQAWVTKAVDAFNRFKAGATELLQRVTPVVLEIVKELVTMGKKIYAAVVPFVESMVPVLVKSWGTIYKTLQPLATTLGRLFSALAPVVLAFVAGVYKFVTTYLPPVLSVVLGVFQTILSTAIPIVATIIADIISGFTAVVNWFMTIWPMISVIMGRVWAVLQVTWAAIGPFVMAAVQNLVTVIKNGFLIALAIVQFVWTTIKAVIKIAWAVISGIITTALAILTGDWQTAWEAFTGIFTGVWDGITDFMGGVGKLFYDSGKAIINTLVDGIKSVADAPAKAVKGVLDKVRDFLPFSDAKKGPLSSLTYSGGAIMTTLSTGVDKQQKSLQKSVNGAFDSLGLNRSASLQVLNGGLSGAAPLTSGVDIPKSSVSSVSAPAAQAKATTVNVERFVDRIEIVQQPGEDAEALADRVIDRLHEKAQDAAGRLAAADREELAS